MLRSLICGGAASLAVDMSLYPIDTIKTRLQSEQGFRAAGGFRHLYRGISSVALGAAPNAALFFFAYEEFKLIFNIKCKSFNISNITTIFQSTHKHEESCL